MAQVVCVDCIAEGITTSRPTPYGGPRSPRCKTHHLARRRQISARAHEIRTEKTYGISKMDYLQIKLVQGGRCAICQKATGATKNLAVDHEHHKEGCTHVPDHGCPRCVRGLLCGPCNELIGRYSIEALVRAIVYLQDPPARKVLRAE
jgi:Recombination endonuclease VII